MSSLSITTRSLFIAILLAYLVMGTLFAIRTPDWQAPDEAAHYNYVAQLASGTIFPVIEAGDWDQEYLNRLTSGRFAPELLDDLDEIRYENHQPPLYYALLTPVYIATEGNLTALRLVSVLMGAAVVVMAFLVTRLVFPDREAVALGVMGFVGLLPQYVHILSSVNNDALALALGSVLLWLTIRYVRAENVPVLGLGVFVGLIFLTKTTVYFMAGIVLVAVLWRIWQDEAVSWRALVVLAVPSGIAALLWWGRNLFVYGWPDFLGLIRHDEVVVGQLRTSELIADVGIANYWQQAIMTTFRSFYGQFGWMAAPMDGSIPGIYLIFLLLVLVALLGWIVTPWIPAIRAELRIRDGSAVWLVLGAVVVLTGLQFAFYNQTFVQFQGRYWYPALIPLAILLVAGIDHLRVAWVSRRSGFAWWTLLLVGALFLLDFYLIWRVIPGSLSPDFL